MAWEILVSVIIPWIRTIVSLPLGLLAIQLFHLAAGRLIPYAYGELSTDTVRWLSLALVTAAGIFGSSVVGAVARHRVWLHMFVFLLVMLFIDIAVIKGDGFLYYLFNRCHGNHCLSFSLYYRGGRIGTG